MSQCERRCRREEKAGKRLVTPEKDKHFVTHNSEHQAAADGRLGASPRSRPADPASRTSPSGPWSRPLRHPGRGNGYSRSSPLCQL
jgi:hypothetical protein